MPMLQTIITMNVRLFLSTFFIVVLSLIVGCSQSTVGSEVIDIQDCDCHLTLDGSNETLIDNALRCFKLTSTGSYKDSLYRLWTLRIEEEPNSKTDYLYTVKLLELGYSSNGRISNLYSLSWRYKNDSFLVEKITKIYISPKGGWDNFDKNIIKKNINNIQNLPLEFRDMENMGSDKMTILQFISSEKVITFDFSLRQKDLAHIDEVFADFSNLIIREFGQYYLN